MYADPEEYENTVELALHVDGCSRVTSYEAEGHGEGGQHHIEEIRLEGGRSNPRVCFGRDANFCPVSAPLLEQQRHHHDHHNQSQNATAWWDVFFRIENELHCLAEDVNFFLPEICRHSLTFEKTLASLEETGELEDVLQTLESRLNSISASYYELGHDKQFLSREAIHKAIECSGALISYREMVSAAESINQFLDAVANGRMFSTSATEAMKRAEDVGMLLDGVDAILDSLESRVERLRVVSEMKLRCVGMLEEDREAIRKMKADFEVIAELTESEFKSNTGFARRMNHYSTVYTAATRTTNIKSSSDVLGYYVDELLYMDFQEMLTRYLLKYRDLHASSETQLFGKILKIWDHYKVLMKWNMRTFAYLSRFYIVNCSKPSLYQVALSIFFEQILKKNIHIVSHVTLELLFAERNGESGNGDQIRSAIELLSSMSTEKKDEIFLEHFLKPYTASTRNYYEGLVSEWCKSSSSSELLRQLEQVRNEEQARCMCYFSSGDRETIMTHVEEVLLDSPLTIEKLLRGNDGFVVALRNRDEALLKMYYNLLSCRTKCLTYLSNLTREEIMCEGSERLLQHHSQEKKEIDIRSCVTDMLQLKDDFMDLLARCFAGDDMMLKAVRGGLEKAFSGSVHTSRGQQRSVPFSELLAYYVDAVLQGNGVSTNEDELERAIAALTYVSDRDAFLAHSRDLLAQRILFPRRKFDEVIERSLIQRISQRCGLSSTSYLEGMLHDVDISEGFGAAEKLRDAGEFPSFALSVLVLKKGIWPPRIQSELFRPPPIIERTLRAFQDIYLRSTTGRVLTWSYSNSSGDVSAAFGKEMKILSMTGLQCWVMLAFNDSKELTPNDMMRQFGLTLEDLKPVLLPLLKCSVLRAEVDGTSLHGEEKLLVNESFSSKWKKVRVPVVISRRDGALNSEIVAKEVEEDRRPAVDACLVRIMKSRRVLSHSSLVEECQQKLAPLFVVDPKLIKERIEELIRKEYIERDQKIFAVYHYTA